MIFGKDTWIETLTERIHNRLTTQNVLPEAQIVDYLGEIDDLLEDPAARTFICIAPMSLPVNQAQVAGGGAAKTAFDSIWRIDICVKMMERQNRTMKLLSDASKSLATLTKATIAAMQVQAIPLEGQSSDIDLYSPVRQPIRLVRATFNPRRPKAGWGWCRTEWQVYFRTDFTA